MKNRQGRRGERLHHCAATDVADLNLRQLLAACGCVCTSLSAGWCGPWSPLPGYHCSCPSRGCRNNASLPCSQSTVLDLISIAAVCSGSGEDTPVTAQASFSSPWASFPYSCKMGWYFQRAVLTTAVMKYPETFADPGRANCGTSHAWYLCLELCFGICTSHSRVISIQQSLLKAVLHLLCAGCITRVSHPAKSE